MPLADSPELCRVSAVPIQGIGILWHRWLVGYKTFGLTLMVTHACNMRCHYCYTGEKTARRMSAEVGDAAIRRAIASLEPAGRLELGFFGGEPLLEAAAIRRWIDLARLWAKEARVEVSFHLTTNGTVESAIAWDVLNQEDVRVAVSCDGLPEVHDRFRVYAGGRGTFAAVRLTMERLHALGKPFSVVMVVRPETVGRLGEGIRNLRTMGVTSIEPSVDLWTHWTREDAQALRHAIAGAADLWLEGLPGHALNWFDEKAAGISGIHAKSGEGRCGFGDGEVAVAPSGRLYPCERLIGEDRPDNPMRLEGHVLDSQPDFTLRSNPPAPGRQAEACHSCAMHGMCNTDCRCSNFVRTGDIRRPDGLLCMLNQACLEEVAERLQLAPRTSRLHVCQG